MPWPALLFLETVEHELHSRRNAELVKQGNQVLVPTISHLQESDPDSIPAVYRESYRLVFFLAVLAFASLTILSPFVSRVWIGSYPAVFVEFVAILALGWLVNVMSNPAYVVDLGTGALRWVSLGCIGTAILNATLGTLAGFYFGGRAIVAVSAFSLACGYLVVLIAYHRENRVPFRELLPKESGALLATSLVGTLLFLPFFCGSLSLPIISLRTMPALIAALVVMILIPVWVHPLRKRLIRWVFSRAHA